MNPIDNKPGIVIANATQVLQMEAMANDDMLEEELDDGLESALAAHIMSVFEDNVNSRRTSGIEDKMLQSLRAYNGNYDPEDLEKIRATGGSDIYMNLTPTKCRAAMSWIRDILMPAKEAAWSLSPTPIPEVPEDIKNAIKAEVNKFLTGEEAVDPDQPQPANRTAAAATKIKDANRLQQDLEEAFREEVYKIAEKEVKKYERLIADQFAEGEWDKALSDFIEDFCVFPVAVMKGPIVVKDKRLSWENGRPVPKEKYRYMNKRVSPLDIYPSSSATDINDGNLCEHIRFHRKELYDLKGVKGYKSDAISELLEMSGGTEYPFITASIEEEKAAEEYRGDSFEANLGLYHGVHYMGSASYEMLEEWGYDMSGLGDDPLAEFEIEAIVVGTKIIKCRINEDPLLRRPYYKASFQHIPGSWWGRSLPETMRDVQRLCNATARALANNMGVASGPQVEVYTDRLGADQEISEMVPFKIWQVTSDPSGGTGRAIQWWQPSSNAGELLTVYKEFEIRADDATGIPRYAYGNERTGGAAQTASGLSMLLESASKGIKDAIRHIDEGVIKPRVEYQFYKNMVDSAEEHKFSGDIEVVAKGSQALTMRGAQEMRRNEFLQIVANPEYMKIIGVEGVADILREMAKSLGLGENIVPSRIELKHKIEQEQKQQMEMAKKEQEIKQNEQAVGVQQVQLQTQQAEAASQRNAQIKMMELQEKKALEENKLLLKAHEMAQKREEEADRQRTELMKQQMVNAQRDRETNKNIALSVQSGFRDKNNQE